MDRGRGGNVRVRAVASLPSGGGLVSIPESIHESSPFRGGPETSFGPGSPSSVDTSGGDLRSVLRPPTTPEERATATATTASRATGGASACRLLGKLTEAAPEPEEREDEDEEPTPAPQGEPREVSAGATAEAEAATMATNETTTTTFAASGADAAAHLARPAVPGPFVVLQGVPGDGMANVLDSMPILEYHGSEPPSPAVSRRGSLDGANVAFRGDRDVGGSGGADGTSEGSDAAVPPDVRMASIEDDDNDGSQSNDDGQRQTNSQTLSLSRNTSTSNESFQHVDANNDGGASKNDDDNQRIGGNDAPSSSSSAGSAVLIFGPTGSLAGSNGAGGTAAAPPQQLSGMASAAATQDTEDNQDVLLDDVDNDNGGGVGVSPVAARALLEGRATEGGLHLPIPPTVGCGGGTVLPPLGRMRLRSHTANSADMGGVGVGVDMDIGGGETCGPPGSFVMVTDNSGGNTNMPNEAMAAHEHERRVADINAQDMEVEQTLQGSPNVTGGASASFSAASSNSNDSAAFEGEDRSLSRAQRRAVLRWTAERRERERRQREETVLDGYGYGVRRHGIGPRAAVASALAEEWWQKEGRLAVFDRLPSHQDLDRVRNAPDTNDITTAERAVRSLSSHVVGTLAPGTAVLASASITLDSATLCPIPDDGGPVCPLGAYRFLTIESPIRGHILWGRDDGYAFLGPGLPERYADPEVWAWRVTCPDGALIREGLELTSAHVDTVPHGSLVRVTRKTVNSMGLSRLRIEAILYGSREDSGTSNNGSRCQRVGPAEIGSDGGLEAILLGSGSGARGSGGRSSYGDGGPQNQVDPSHESQSNPKSGRVVAGWISETLNPLSGQRGPVVQPVPFPVPVKYRVRLAEGAVIRSDVELSSPSVGVAPSGSVISVVGRAFSEHPTDQCVERLKLAGGRGWVSVRLNRAPPLDETLVELVGTDGSYDPERPGSYHLRERDRAMREYQEQMEREQREAEQRMRGGAEESPSLAGIGASNGTSVVSGPQSGRVPDRVASLVGSASARLRRVSSTAELSSIPDDESESAAALGIGQGASSGPVTPPVAGTGVHMPTLFRGGYTGGMAPMGGFHSGGGIVSGSGGTMGMAPPGRSETCLICLTEERNATIVHGGTGHIACCLTCARILAARGDRCPVCRLPIDCVIQQFWA